MAEPKQKPGQSKQDYATPMNFIEAVKKRLGITEFAIDLAADATNTKASRYFDEARDALSIGHWEDHIGPRCWGWLNPPFADIKPWARRCKETAAAGGQIAFLVPAAVGSNWFRDYVDGYAHVLLLNGRLAFMPDKPKWLYPKDCILCLYGLGNQGYRVWTWNDATPRRRRQHDPSDTPGGGVNAY